MNATTFAAIGRRLHVVADQHNAADVRTSTVAEYSAEYRACEDEMSRLLNEEITLRDLVLSMRPETLEDAATWRPVPPSQPYDRLRNK